MEEKYVRVRNLMSNKVGYTIEEDHIVRIFEPKEIKSLPVSELRKASYKKGVRVLLKEYLCIEDEKLAQELVGITPDIVEYKWDESKIDEVLTNGSLDELLDALDFAPVGIKDMIVYRAVEMQINDVSKREAITKKTGKDIDQMIKYYKEEQEEAGNKGEVQQRTRRVQSERPTPSADEIKPVRRVQG